MKLQGISKFPNFEKLDIKHKEVIEEFVSNYDPYSDYEFTSLYSWNIADTNLISEFNGNLIVIFKEYNYDDLFIGVIGDNLNKEDTDILLNYSESIGLKRELKLIPEHLIVSELKENFIVQEDESNNDYIYDVHSLLNYSGRKLRGKKNLLNRFIKNYTDVKVIEIDPFSEEASNICNELLKVCHNKESDFLDEEKRIISKSLSEKSLNIKLITVFINDKIAWFCIYEITKQGYLTIHFEKFDTAFEGINAFCKTETSKIAIRNNCNFINFEQDLGIEGLRLGKKSFCPIKYLKKYIIKDIV